MDSALNGRGKKRGLDTQGAKYNMVAGPYVTGVSGKSDILGKDIISGGC
jgi:hypothetical protein